MSHNFVTTKAVYEYKDGEYQLVYEEGYLYSGPMALCCGPSKAMKALNTTQQNFTNTVISQAQTIFGAASTVFNTLMSSWGSIVKGGPSQQGWSGTQMAIQNAQVVDQTAAAFRNAKAATGNAVSAIGGGNTVLPSGLSSSLATSTALAAAETETAGLRQNQISSLQQGNQNYWNATSGMENLPSVFDSSTAANQVAQKSLTEAQVSQNEMDTESNWWKTALEGGVAGALQGPMSNLPGMGGK